MKVLFFVTGLAYGGAETETVNLAIGVKKKGIDVSIVSIRTPLAYVSELEAVNIKVYSLNKNTKLNTFLGIPKLCKILKLESPDVVHSQMYRPNILSRFLKMVTPSAKYRLINTIQNNFEGGEFKKLAHKLTKHIPDVISHVSRLGYQNYINEGLIDERKAIFISNSVNMSAFDCVEPFNFQAFLGLKQDTFVFLAVGRLERQKDYPNLFKAIDQVRNLVSAPFVVCIAGQGPLEQSLRQMIDEMNLAKHVYLLGLRKDIPNLLKGANCFLMSSEWEGTPLGLLEAMGASLPAVVTEAGDNKFIVLHEENGFVVPVSRSDLFAESVIRMLELTNDRRSEMALKSRAIASANFDRAAIVEQWIDVYNNNM